MRPDLVIFRAGGARSALEKLHFRLQSVELRVRSNTPELSHLDLASSPGEIAEDQHSVGRLRTKTEKQTEQCTRCELNELDEGRSMNAVVAFEAIRKRSAIGKNLQIGFDGEGHLR